MNHPLWGRRNRSKQVVLACLIVALAGVLLSVLGSANTGPDTAATGPDTAATGDPTWMAPPTGYSAGQLIFDDQFHGTSLDPAHWDTVMIGQGDGVLEFPWPSCW